MLSVESIDSVLKSYYLDAICTSLNTGVSPLYQAIEKTAAEIRGKEAVSRRGRMYESGFQRAAEKHLRSHRHYR